MFPSFFPQGKSCKVVIKYVISFSALYVSESQLTKVNLAFREDTDNICSGFNFCRNSLCRLELTVGKSLCYYTGELHPCFRQFVVCQFTALFSSDAF